MNLFNNIGRAYKDKSPEKTIKHLEKILNYLNIKIKYMKWCQFINGVYSVRIESENPYFGANGKGRTQEYALASAYAEYLERLLNGLLILGFPYRKFLLDRIKKETGHSLFIDEKILNKKDLCSLPTNILCELFNCKAFKVINSIDNYINTIKRAKSEIIGIPFLDIQANKYIYLPVRLLFSLTGSTGMAAGNSLYEAIYQALCEILERYAAAYIYYNQLTPPTISTKVLIQYTEEFQIMEEIETHGIHLVVKDFSSGLGLPVIGLIAYNSNKTKYKLNVGCDTSIRVALSRVLTEIQQGCESLEEWEETFLPIPRNTPGYFTSKDQKSKRQVISEFEKFTENSSGIFPKALFEKESSYNVNLNVFETHKNYQEEVEHLISLISKLGSNVYIRDVSFHNFYCVYVYIPNNISCVARKKIKLTVNEYDYSSDEKYYLTDHWFRGHFFLDNGKILSYCKELFPKLTTESILRISIDKVLRLQFNPEFYLSHLPIGFLATLSEYKNKQYEKALYYYQFFLEELGVKENEYFENIKKFLKDKIDKTVNNEKQLYKKIQDEFDKDNIFSNLLLPNCPNCRDCLVKSQCLSKRNTDFQKFFINKCNSNFSKEAL